MGTSKNSSGEKSAAVFIWAIIALPCFERFSDFAIFAGMRICLFFQF